MPCTGRSAARTTGSARTGPTPSSTLDDLPAVRGRGRRRRRQPGPGHRESAHGVFAAYTDMVATMFASHDRFALVVDDADLRQGDDLVHYSSHATDSVAQLVDDLLYVGWGTGGIDEPVEAAAVSKLARDVEKQQRGRPKTKGTGDYAAAADACWPTSRSSGMVPFAPTAIASGGAVDPAALLATTPLGADGPLPGVPRQVVDVLERRADELRSQADARRRWYVGRRWSP